MAKTQTFGDKLKKKRADIKPTIKVISWYRCPLRGTLRASERLIKLDDLADVEKLEIIR